MAQLITNRTGTFIIVPSPYHNSGVEIKWADFNSGTYWKAVDLRRDVLRTPLGLDFELSDLAKESSDSHLVAVEGGRVVGCLVMTPIDTKTVKMRQVAVHPDRQCQGIGQSLVAEAERWSAESGFESIVLNARETALKFYLDLDYETKGDPFVEVTIPHQMMFKRIRT